jgi:hypothetical protein
MTRLPHYLTYHRCSQEMGDIDPSYNMLRYVCDRFELNVEQRYWLAFVYAMTYCGASTFYVYNEFPDYENVDINRMSKWWASRGRAEIICQTDRRWVRSGNMFVPAVESYQKWLRGRSQHEHFTALASGDTPEERYDRLYRSAKQLHSFGQFALFLYLEALHTITPLDLVPTNLDLTQAHSCRNGLVYAFGLDQWLTEGADPMPADGRPEIMAAWEELRPMLQPASTVWQIETTLCAYKKFHRGKRYLGYYIDRQALETAKMAAHVKHGVCWDVLWQFRAETYEAEVLAEDTYTPERLAKGLPTAWKDQRMQFTSEALLEES